MSTSASSPPQVSAAAMRGKTTHPWGDWLLTLGDLLTLLLCFFVAIISLSPLNARRGSSVTAGTEKSFSAQGPLTGSAGQSGTTFANYEKGDPVLGRSRGRLDLYFSSSDLAPDGVTPGEGARVSLKNQVIPAGYALEDVIISACADSDGGDVNGAWRKSEARVLGLRGQILDAPGFAAVKPGIRILGPECEALEGVEQNGEPAVMHLRLSLEKTADG